MVDMWHGKLRMRMEYMVDFFWRNQQIRGPGLVSRFQENIKGMIKRSEGYQLLRKNK